MLRTLNLDILNCLKLHLKLEEGGGGLVQNSIWKMVRIVDRARLSAFIVGLGSRHGGISCLEWNLRLKTLADVTESHPISLQFSDLTTFPPHANCRLVFRH